MITNKQKYMKAFQVNQTNVIAKAVQFVNYYNMGINDAVRKGIMLEELKQRMVNGELVKFKYMKVDGSIRNAIGTLQADVVAANTKANGTYRKPQGAFCYIDLESFGWRSFREERLIEILN